MERKIHEPNERITLENNGKCCVFRICGKIGSGVMSVGYKAIKETPDGDEARVLLKFCPKYLEFGSKAYIVEKERFEMKTELHRKLENIEETVNQTAPYLGRFTDIDGNPWIETTWINGSFLSELNNDTTKLPEYIGTIASLLRAARGYHAAGYLFLALKPESIQVYTPDFGVEGIRILDFGSMMEKAVILNKENRADTLISFSQKWSAPEVKNERYNDISEKSDIYSIGLILYHYMFGKLPDYAFDIVSSLKRDFQGSKALFGTAVNSVRIRNIFFELFSSLLAYDVEERSSDQEAIEKIVQIQREIEPKGESRLDLANTSLPKATDRFILGDRDNHENGILECLREHRPVVIQGGGGVGKSELVLDFAIKHSSSFDFYYLTYSRSIQHTLLKLPTEPPIKTTKIGDDGQTVKMTEHEIYLNILKCIRKYGRETVLIIDNLDEEDDSETCTIQDQHEYDELISLPVNIICTSRYNGFENTVTIPLGESRSICLQLLKSYLPSINDIEAAALVDAVEDNTLVVDIIGRTISESEKLGANITVSMMLDALKGEGDFGEFEAVRSNYRGDRSERNVLQHLEQIFKVSKMKSALDVLLFMSQFPVNGISKPLVYYTFNKENDRRVYRQLIATGWIREKTIASTSKVYLHPAVNTVVKKMADKVKYSSIISKFITPFSSVFASYFEDDKKKRKISSFFAEDLDFAGKIADEVLSQKEQHGRDVIESAADVYSALAQYYYSISDRIDLRIIYSSNAVRLLETIVEEVSDKERNAILLKLARQKFYLGIAEYDIDLFEKVLDDFDSAMLSLDNIDAPDESEAVDRDTIKAQIFERKGELLQGTGDWETVRENYRKAVELSTKTNNEKELARAHRCLGMALGDNGRVLDSVRELKKGLDHNDFGLRAYNCIGLYVSMTGLYDIALKNYYRALDSWDGSRQDPPIFLYINLVNCNCELGRFSEAEKWAAKACAELFRDSSRDIALSAVRLLKKDDQEIDLHVDDLHWKGSTACLVCLCLLYTVCKRDGNDVNIVNAAKLVERAVTSRDSRIRLLCERLDSASASTDSTKIEEWAKDLEFNKLTAALLTKRLGQFYYLTGNYVKAYGFGLASYHLYSDYRYPFGIAEAAILSIQAAAKVSLPIPEQVTADEARCKEILANEREALLNLKSTELRWLFE